MENLVLLFVRGAVFGAGLALVAVTLYSAVATFVVPRSQNNRLTGFVFRSVLKPFAWRVRRVNSYEARDQLMAFFAPTALLALPPVWLTLVWAGYSAMFWATGSGVLQALEVSGSSLFTLGFVGVGTVPQYALAFSEAFLGLALIAILIAYLPSIYSAFQRREQMVNLLEVRAGSPPTAWEMIERYNRIHGLNRLNEQWRVWEQWFVDVEESHTSIAAVVFFRSQQPERSWITAAGAVLDAAALARSTLDIERDAQADLCLRAGYLCLRRICDFFKIPYNAAPKSDDPISIARVEYDQVYEELRERGVPVKADREQAWHDFAGWRVNYDRPLLALAALTMAPYAPWSSDRSLRGNRLALDLSGLGKGSLDQVSHGEHL